MPVLGSLVLLLCSCGGSDPSGVEVPSSVDVGVAGDGELGAVLAEMLADYGQPAMAAMLIRDGAVVESAAVGLRAIGFPEEVTINDQWRIGSMTKAMTATLAGILVEQGAIEWEATIGEIFVELDSIHPDWEDVRLEEFLSHTSGMRRDGSYGIGDSRLERAAVELQYHPPENTRGEITYSNKGYFIAGTMLEVATDESWESLTQREIFEPLKMASSGFGAPSRSGNLQPAGHERTEAGEWHLIELELRPISGPVGIVHTTLADYSTWVLAHLDGANGIGGLVTAETFATMHTPKPGTIDVRIGGLSIGGYGFGWVIGMAGDEERFGGETLSHRGTRSGWISGVWLVPDRDFAIVVFVNADTPVAEGLRTEAVDAILERHNAAFGR